jgi:hypothetical protein
MIYFAQDIQTRKEWADLFSIVITPIRKSTFHLVFISFPNILHSEAIHFSHFIPYPRGLPCWGKRGKVGFPVFTEEIVFLSEEIKNHTTSLHFQRWIKGRSKGDWKRTMGNICL